MFYIILILLLNAFQSTQPIHMDNNNSNRDTAIFASGCFWGTEYYMKRADGVISTQVGYIGGHVANPSYRQVCTGTTGHAEAVRVIFDPNKTDYETLCRLFFETHDPTQLNRQGPDVGTQYRSAVFVKNEEQRKITEALVRKLIDQGLQVVTEVNELSEFYVAEDYHQDYYDNKGGMPYCHSYTKRFND
ncbi:MAG: peptide-methionine (S)-S-oxide reductase MsrA [Cryomorphaceae bacterium]|nr:peptide-methionine (S)-S-oxide reductase MsrA [Cryomorphaceae bacterium]